MMVPLIVPDRGKTPQTAVFHGQWESLLAFYEDYKYIFKSSCMPNSNALVVLTKSINPLIVGVGRGTVKKQTFQSLKN